MPAYRLIDRHHFDYGRVAHRRSATKFNHLAARLCRPPVGGRLFVQFGICLAR